MKRFAKIESVAMKKPGQKEKKKLLEPAVATQPKKVVKKILNKSSDEVVTIRFCTSIRVEREELYKGECEQGIRTCKEI